MKKALILISLVLVAAFAGAWSGKSDLPSSSSFGAAGVVKFDGSSTNGEVSVGTTDTNIVARSVDRSYIIVCKTSPGTAGQITFAINSSASHGRGIVLDSRRPCWESNDLNLVSGLIEGVASPSAASVSYSQW